MMKLHVNVRALALVILILAHTKKRWAIIMVMGLYSYADAARTVGNNALMIFKEGFENERSSS
jgi:hypothetical protein